MTPKEFSALTGIDERKVRRWLRSHKIQGEQANGFRGEWNIPESEATKFRGIDTDSLKNIIYQKPEKRKTVTTSVAESLQKEFKIACTIRDMKMNEVLEKLMILFIKDSHILDKLMHSGNGEK